jgi:glycosyltransferase involved in cell wall biosynthesis
MIILYHKNKEITSVFDVKKNQEFKLILVNINAAFITLAKANPNRLLVWCDEENRGFINLEYITSECLQNNKMISFSENNFISSRIGYIEESPFLNINKTVKYPTWLMSSLCGAMHSQSVLSFESILNNNDDFVFNLNAIAKLGMPNGLWCYSTPDILLKKAPKRLEFQINDINLFKFVKQHYKPVWTLLLFLNGVIHEKRFYFLALFLSLFSQRQKINETFKIEVERKDVKKISTYDVIIPTLGRATYLYDVLVDLANQSISPSNVIIIEQDSSESSFSELNYLKTENWPFFVIHEFIHKTGACNARNLALTHVVSDYVFFADDDIRLGNKALSKSLGFMIMNRLNAITLSCKRNNESEILFLPIQSTFFGSGCSIVKKSALQNVSFNIAFEHGFGEDADFGMQLRNKGIDIIYYSEVNLNHLKAPIGGFRKPFQHPWDIEKIKPKPSPTVLLFKIINNTKEQVLGYKIILFFKYYKHQEIKNPIRYLVNFKKQWHQSIFWANKLKE